MEKKTGIVSIVAKTGGIKIEGSDEWLNPTKECKDYVKPEFKGQLVELSMIEGDKFNYIKIINGPAKGSQPDTEILIIRQCCIKAAAELAGHTSQSWKEIAESMEIWITR
jgi:hypothetical protein